MNNQEELINSEINKIVNKINDCNTQTEIDDIIDRWNLNSNNVQSWIEMMYDFTTMIEIDKIPYLLDSLYRQENKFKFMMFCIVLEIASQKINFVTELERYSISDENYKILLPTLADFIEKQEADIIDVLILILLNKDPMGKLLNEEEREKIIKGFNKEYNMILEFLKDNILDESSRNCGAIEILLDASTHINNKETDRYVIELSKMNVPKNIKIYALIYKVINHIGITEEEIEEVKDSEYYYLLEKVLK